MIEFYIPLMEKQDIPNKEKEIEFFNPYTWMNKKIISPVINFIVGAMIILSFLGIMVLLVINGLPTIAHIYFLVLKIFVAVLVISLVIWVCEELCNWLIPRMMINQRKRREENKKEYLSDLRKVVKEEIANGRAKQR